MTAWRIITEDRTTEIAALGLTSIVYGHMNFRQNYRIFLELNVGNTHTNSG